MSEGNVNQSTIAAEVEIVGSIKTSGSIQIDGKLDGQINVGGDVTIGKTAVIKGDLDVNSATIAGQVTGNVTAKDKVELQSSAKLTGDVKAKRLAVEDGVTFVGRSEVNPSGAAVSNAKDASKSEPELVGAAAGDEGSKGLFGKK